MVGKITCDKQRQSQPQSSPTPAERQAARVDARQARQAQRIDAGVSNGSLTVAEQTRLANQQAHVDQLEQRIEQDGKVTRREAHVMEHAQDRTSHTIAHAKHDHQRAHKTAAPR